MNHGLWIILFYFYSNRTGGCCAGFRFDRERKICVGKLFFLIKNKFKFKRH